MYKILCSRKGRGSQGVVCHVPLWWLRWTGSERLAIFLEATTRPLQHLVGERFWHAHPEDNVSPYRFVFYSSRTYILDNFDQIDRGCDA
jgi:hypothetical protein